MVDESMASMLLNNSYTEAPKIHVQEQPTASTSVSLSLSSSFPSFSRLPAELALQIWKQTLIQTRLIGITVGGKQGDARPLDQNRASEHNIEEGDHGMQLTTHHVPSALLQTNRESRRAALEFYRIHILRGRSSTGEKQYLYIHPELDFLSLRIDGNVDGPEVLADFLYVLKASDPRGIGILNLGIECQGFNPNIAIPLDPEKIAPRIRQRFTETISALQYVFFHCICSGDGRLMFDSLDMEEVVFNRAFPIHSSAEAFDFVESDPRPIDAYLDKIGLGRDPRSIYWLWMQMERNFGITRKPGTTRFAYHFTAPAWGPTRPPYSRKDAIEQVQGEYKLWRSKWTDQETFGRLGYDDPDTPDLLKNAPVPVFGFWIFPLDALEEPPEEAPRFWDNKTVINLRKHRPRLAVAHLL